jgi:hypothetical protein
MNFLQREVAEHHAHLALESLQHELDRGGRLLAVRALKIPVLDEGHGRVLRAERVIDRAHRYSQIALMVLVHARLL